jgi:tetratricopeptide (TPR) repeat protein
MRRMIRRTLALSIFGALLFAANSAVADDGDICFRESGDAAIAACNRVIDSKGSTLKSRADAYNNRGQEWYGKKDYDRAIADFDSAINLNPKGLTKYGAASVQARSNRGNVYSAKGDAKLAIASYAAAIAIDPEFPAAYTGRGLQYEKLGEIDKARADFKAALPLKPKYPDGQWAIDTARRHIEALKDK